MVKDERIIYLSQGGVDPSPYFNLPEKNTAFVLLGKGTSVTDAAARKLADSRVVIGFCGSGGTPLFSTVDVAFLNPISEYGPTSYMQNWFAMWMDDNKRLLAGIILLDTRLEWLIHYWQKYFSDIALPNSQMKNFKQDINHQTTTQGLLLAEARWAKSLYKHLALHFGISKFSRQPRLDDGDAVEKAINNRLDHGNYLAYGYAACALTGLGISYTLPILHGKTRRGALVFDIADVFKDAIILPLSFIAGAELKKDGVLRAEIIDTCFKSDLLSDVFKFVKELPERVEKMID